MNLVNLSIETFYNVNATKARIDRHAFARFNFLDPFFDSSTFRSDSNHGDFGFGLVFKSDVSLELSGARV